MPENLSVEMPKVDDAIPQSEPGETPDEFKARLAAIAATREGVTPGERGTEARFALGHALRLFSQLPPQEMDVVAGQLDEAARKLIADLHDRMQRIPYQEPHENT